MPRARSAGDGKLERSTATPASETVALYTDADCLAQVFINLISNAQKYCDAETTAPVDPGARQLLRPGRGGFHRQRKRNPAAPAGADLRGNSPAPTARGARRGRG